MTEEQDRWFVSVRISELPDSDFTNYRTRISLIRGQFCAGWSLA